MIRFFNKLGDLWRYINSKSYLLLAFYAVIAVLWYILYSRQEKRFNRFAHSNTKITVGVIDSTSYVGYPNWYCLIYYTFEVNNQYLRRYQRVDDIITQDLRQLVGQTFYVYYDSSNPEKYHYMPITPMNFERMDLPFPDSLEWVNEIVDPGAEPLF